MPSRLFPALVLLLMAATARGGSFQDDSWEERLQSPGVLWEPSPRTYHTAVWSGSEVIVWGGLTDLTEDRNSDQTFLNDGRRYDPAANSWKAMTRVGSPTARYGHSAVWTGTEMIVWGGIDDDVAGDPNYLQAGGRYNPATDTWSTISASDAPRARYKHSAIWTGTEMIVWGGSSQRKYLTSGGRYNPRTDSWRPVNPQGAPFGRIDYSVIWTGSEMIIWGGLSHGGSDLNSGARYSPTSDTWTPVTFIDAPTPRYGHTAVWTGAEMIVWGGGQVGQPHRADGRRYNPTTDSWRGVATGGAPAGRVDHIAIWTGEEMIIWGGLAVGGYIVAAQGARYNPMADSWGPMSWGGNPRNDKPPTTVWTGSAIVLWGGTSTDTSTVRFIQNPNLYFPPTGEFSRFRVTGLTYNGAELVINFPTVIGRRYSLWAYDPGGGYWSDRGVPVLEGTGAALGFTVPVRAATTELFRVKESR